ncbi:AdipoR/hemolysin-III-related, partial [Trinorchestia longiramus]
MKVTLKSSLVTLSGSDFILSKLDTVRKEAQHCYNKATVFPAADIDEVYREVGILQGYRTNYSFFQIIISLFKWNNETINFWTHIFPAAFFAWKLAFLYSTQPLLTDAYWMPLACYLFSCFAYPFASAIAHAFSCMSPISTHICFFYDYSTLSFYSWGASVFYYAYCFPESALGTYYSYSFLPVAAFNSVLSTFLACSSRIKKRSKFATSFRLGSFVIPYIWVSCPLIYRLLTCDPLTDSCGDSTHLHISQFVLVLAASFFYATHLPEKLLPGYFDFIGNSHNLLHIFGVTATYQQMCGGLIDLSQRRTRLLAMGWIVDPLWTWLVTPLVIFASFVIVTVSSRILEDVRPFHCRSRASER